MGTGSFPITLATANVQTLTSQDAFDIVNLPTSEVWTPPQYSKPALTIVTIPAANNTVTGQPATPDINYIFDAVLRLQHHRSLQKTQHPVLTGASMSDHAYVQPARVVLDIGISDVMASYPSILWVGADTKSASVWQTLKNLQENKILVNLTTRLDFYEHMLIADISTTDTSNTQFGLRASVVFEEVILATVTSVGNSSSRPQTSGSSPAGTIQGQPTDPTATQQHSPPPITQFTTAPDLGGGIGTQDLPYQTDPSIYMDVSKYTYKVPGAGIRTSNNTQEILWQGLGGMGAPGAGASGGGGAGDRGP